jgi:hypothetical protein
VRRSIRKQSCTAAVHTTLSSVVALEGCRTADLT